MTTLHHLIRRLNSLKFAFLRKEVKFLEHVTETSSQLLREDLCYWEAAECIRASDILRARFLLWQVRTQRPNDNIPLNAITKSGVHMNTGNLEKPKWICNRPILALPDFSNSAGCFILDTDVSDSATKAAISQVEQDQQGIIACGSRKLNYSERTYRTVCKKMLAPAHFTKYFRQCLLGKDFIVRNNQASLRKSTWIGRSVDTENCEWAVLRQNPGSDTWAERQINDSGLHIFKLHLKGWSARMHSEAVKGCIWEARCFMSLWRNLLLEDAITCLLDRSGCGLLLYQNFRLANCSRRFLMN